MIEYLMEKGGYTSSGLTIEEKKELEGLRKEVKRYREIDDGNSIDQSLHSDSEEDSNDSEDAKRTDEEIKKRRERKKEKKRAAVSAEAYGEINKKEDFKPRIIKKTEEQINKIKLRIVSSFLFSNLEPNELDIVIGAMDEAHFKEGETVIKQGDDGDCLFVVEDGNLDCSKHFTPDGEEKYLKTYYPGEAFGELALLYNAPRAATIKAKTDCDLWVLDRETFNNIVKDAAQKKREKYEAFLKKVDILSTIDSYELTQICDAVKSSVYMKGDFIIKEGESGDVFYILEEGECIASKRLEPGKPPEEIKRYHSGEYFGERALIKGEPRYANIEVVSDTCRILSLDRNSFKRLLGPIEPLLQRNIEKYKKFVNV